MRSIIPSSCSKVRPLGATPIGPIHSLPPGPGSVLQPPPGYDPHTAGVILHSQKRVSTNRRVRISE